MSTRRVDSRICGPLMRMPSWAPRPVPTIRAVGVARPSAHGHAMIRTATEAVNAAVAECPVASHAVSVRDSECDDDRHEHGRDAVGQPLHLGLAVLRVFDEARDLGQLGVGADPGGADYEPPAGIDRGPGD